VVNAEGWAGVGIGKGSGPVSINALLGPCTVSLSGNYNGNVTGSFGMNITDMLPGGASNALALQGTVTGGHITGTWTLTGGSGCTGNGIFTRTDPSTRVLASALARASCIDPGTAHSEHCGLFFFFRAREEANPPLTVWRPWLRSVSG